MTTPVRDSSSARAADDERGRGLFRRLLRWEDALARTLFALGQSPRRSSGRGHAGGFLRLFLLVERVLEHGHPMRPLQPDGVIRYEVAALPRRARNLPVEPAIARGERAVIIHFDNKALVRLAAAVPDTRALTWRIARQARRDLAALAKQARAGAFPAGPRFVWAEGLLAPSLSRLGFATHESAPGASTLGARLFLLAMLAIYSPDGMAHLKSGHNGPLPLTQAWMTLDVFERRFGAVAPAAPAG